MDPVEGGGRGQDNPEVWDDAFRRGRFVWEGVHSGLIEVIGLFKEENLHSVLDLGCGAGRHLPFLAHQGLQVTGADISLEAIELARNRLEAEKVHGVRLDRASMDSLPYGDESLDAVVSIYTLHHNTFGRARRVISEIQRVLRKGGLFYGNFRGRRCWQPEGHVPEPYTSVPTEGDEAGVPHHFFSREELEELFTGFQVIWLRHTEMDESDPARPVFGHHDFWEILARK